MSEEAEQPRKQYRLKTEVTFVRGGAGLVLFNCTLTWVRWGVMDDY